ncbi:MAG: hypothetical protein KDN05_14220, partial [Verrucomicrobiae bacterium]|nr:hypothetical protein [Verrucomicrobiae bacterium]
MPAKIHRIKLTEDERRELEAIRDQKRGKTSQSMRAAALLMADEGPCGPASKDTEIHRATGIALRTIERFRRKR